MVPDSKQKTSSQEEINIIDLFILLGDFLGKLFRGFLSLLKFILVFLLQKWYYFLISLIFTGLAAFLFTKLLDPYYKSDLIIRSNTPHSQVIISSVNKLGAFAEEGNFAELSKELGLNIEEVSSIRNMEVSWYYDIGDDGIFDGISSDVSILADTNYIMIDSLLIIRAEVHEPEIFSQLEAGIKQSLNGNSYLLASNQQRITALNSTLAQTNYEIQKLDSLQKREYFTRTDETRLKEGQLVFTNDKTIRLYHNEMFQLLDLKQETEKDLEIYSDIVATVEEFSVPVKPENGLIYYAKKIVWILLAVGLFFAGIITYRKRIWMELK